MDELIKIFIAGVALGNGPCLFFCIPIILPYIGGCLELGIGSCNWKRALSAAILIYFGIRLIK